jgi:general stress protein 26
MNEMENEEHNVKNLDQEKAVEKMKELVDHTNTCLFTTSFDQTPVQARPMATQKVDDDGCFWFFSEDESNKNFELEKDSRVQLFYSNPGKSEYMTVFGHATIITDRNKIEELWTPIVKAWFKGGKDDPSLTLIQVSPEQAYYWDTKNNKMISLVKIVGSIFSGKVMDDGIEGAMSVR